MTAYNLPNYERQTEILNKTNDIKFAIDSGTIGKTPRKQIFTTNGTWIAPAGVTRVFITGGGAGGSGSAIAQSTATQGLAGGTTSFDTLLSLVGGAGGIANANQGNAIGGLPGGPGGQMGGIYFPSNTSNSNTDSVGGASGPYFGGKSSPSLLPPINRKGGYCSGGGAFGIGSGAAGAGGGGDFVFDHQLTVVPGTSYTITIGIGGASVEAGGYQSGAGGNGILILEWWG